MSASGPNTAAIAPVSSTVRCGHLPTARADRLQRGVERQRAGGDQRAVLTEAVPHHHVRPYAVRGQQVGQREVGGEHGGLGDLGLQQLLLGRRMAASSSASTKMYDVSGRPSSGVMMRSASANASATIGSRSRRRAQHVDVLGALTGVEERDLRRRAAAEEHALRAQHPPQRRVAAAQRGQRLAGLGRQLGGVGVVDRHPDRRRRPGPGPVAAGSGACPAARLRAGAGRAAQRPRPRPGRRPRRRRAAAPSAARPPRWLATVARLTLGAATAKRTAASLARGTGRARTPPAPRGSSCHRSRTRSPRRDRAPPGGGAGHSRSDGVDPERGLVPVHVRVGWHEVQARRQHLVVQAHHHLEQPGRAGRGLEVADVGLDRAERGRPRRRAGLAEHLGEDWPARWRRRPGSRCHAPPHRTPTRG